MCRPFTPSGALNDHPRDCVIIAFVNTINLVSSLNFQLDVEGKTGAHRNIIVRKFIFFQISSFSESFGNDAIATFVYMLRCLALPWLRSQTTATSTGAFGHLEYKTYKPSVRAAPRQAPKAKNGNFRSGMYRTATPLYELVGLRYINYSVFMVHVSDCIFPGQT